MFNFKKLILLIITSFENSKKINKNFNFKKLTTVQYSPLLAVYLCSWQRHKDVP